MPKLSELNPEQVKVVSVPESKDTGGAIKLSSLKPDQVKVVSVPENPRQPIPEAESAIAGAAQGATLGFGDEIYGAFRGATKALARKGSFTENYGKYRDQNREYNKQAAADNPKSYLGGNLAGGLVTTAAIPGAGALKGAGIIKTGLQTAALGGIAGLGDTEGNLTTPDKTQEMFTDVAKGAAIGGTLGAAGKAVSNAVGALKPSALNAYANKRALTAGGFMSKDIKKLSPAQQQQIGQSLRDNKIVTMFASLDDVAERSKAAKESAGNAIGKALDTVDNHVKEVISEIDTGKLLKNASPEQKAQARKFVTDNFQFNMQRVGQRIKSELIAPDIDNPLVEKELAQLTRLSDSFSEKASKPLGFGNFIKSTQGKQTRFQSETLPEQYKKDVYRIIKEELEDAVAKTGDLEGGLSAMTGGGKVLGNASDIANRNKQSLQDYKGAKDLYGAMKATEKAATDRLGQTNVNRTVSLTDYLAAGSTLASGGTPAAAVAVGALNKALRKYGASTQAVGAGKLADAIQAVQGVTTDKLAAAIGSAVSKSPKLAQRVGGTIAKAATEGKASLVAVHAALLKDPEYAAAMGYQEETTPMQRKYKLQGGQK